MAALSASFARLSVSAPKGKAAAPARLAARSSTAFAAGAVALRKAQPVVKAVRLATVAPVEARHMPGKNGLKTRKAAAKRYKVTAGGKVVRRHAYKGHLLAHKSSKRKRFLSGEAVVEKADIQNVKECLPYARIK